MQLFFFCISVSSGILRSTKKKEKVRPPISPEKVSRGALVWQVQVVTNIFVSFLHSIFKIHYFRIGTKLSGLIIGLRLSCSYNRTKVVMPHIMPEPKLSCPKARPKVVMSHTTGPKL